MLIVQARTYSDGAHLTESSSRGAAALFLAALADATGR